MPGLSFEGVAPFCFAVVPGRDAIPGLFPAMEVAPFLLYAGEGEHEDRFGVGG